jgi:acyl-CoA synthetase (AMP-forming)/AMP-acid ligase II
MIALTHRVAAIARAEPQRVALADGSREIGYGAFLDAAQRLAAFLRARGCKPGERVALILPNRIEAAIAWYGAWLAGAVVVPLNVQARARDFAPWLRHAGARVLIHEAGNRDVDATLAMLAEAPLRIVVGDAAADANADAVTWTQAQADVGEYEHAAASDAPAAIVYTSGTTGAPKGVTLTHANFAANVDAIVAYLDLSGADSVVSILPFYYSYGASLLHTHLAVGARLVIESNTVFPQLIVETIARERVSGFSGVPSTFALLLDRVTLAGHDLSSLRYLTQAGGAMSTTLTRRLRDALPQARLYVMYGQTEATARLAWLPPERLDDKPGSAGQAIDGVRLEVRDESGRALPTDTVGEIWVQGPNVMTGYWNDPAASASVLRDGWLRTGDMGRLDAEGFLFLSGRRSDMIKTGAHRVHPLDIEEVIAELDGVSEVAVVGIDDATLGQAIKAVIVRTDMARLDADAVKAHCRARLAGYKIPKQVEFVPDLPKTASGKVRRALLIDPAAPQEAS